ncbi:MAG: hypothetical protein A3F74_25305 [Betaproteobacteria bacterium RIFCSPLOWO2_12_FULL_62_58]|nr:MAG: hypothetical protein A3F74_25305 [Betaproteobacteria bacterium RIFCSPLOWO2_12_FULL_62_58]
MEKTTQPAEPEKVKCEVCLKEILRSEAKSAEAVEYVAYFCGLDCYKQWKANSQAAQSPHPNKSAS